MNRNPVLHLNLNCGCRQNLSTFREAVLHARKMKHSVTFTGAISPLKTYDARRDCNNSFLLDHLDCPNLEVKFSCGDGFNTHSYQKALEHVKKTGHVVQVVGKILKPGLKVGDCGDRPHLNKVPTLVPAVSQTVAGEEGGLKKQKEVMIWKS
ncbi:MAG: hypothetical protein QXG39_01485 [Candidatus Aenigmatarchaeota archaeon]